MAGVLGRLRGLRPTDPEGCLREGQLLLLLGVEGDAGLRLVREGLRGGVGGIEGRVYEAVGLLRQGRTNETRVRLSGLGLEARDAKERTMVCLGEFEMHARAGWVEAALEVYRRIEGENLTALQHRWLEHEYGKLLGQRRGNGSGVPVREP